ncbi:hypothetical protein [Jonesia denitrificans]|uniref:hypothetical protein n=1 Tax=Jonesia denitrificans TaxID=43674 RepID=UPI0011B01DAE|nr:hypothetical protein [Jonesia denitrificans]
MNRLMSRVLAFKLAQRRADIVGVTVEPETPKTRQDSAQPPPADSADSPLIAVEDVDSLPRVHPLKREVHLSYPILVLLLATIGFFVWAKLVVAV